jgi:hypothetical protein
MGDIVFVTWDAGGASRRPLALPSSCKRYWPERDRPSLGFSETEARCGGGGITLTSCASPSRAR